jgi:hypothetical protein
MRKEFYSNGFLFFINLAIVSFIFLLLNNFNLFDSDLFLSSKWFFSIGVFSLLFALLLKYNFNLLKKKSSPFIESIFSSSQYYFLSFLIIIVINQFLKLDFLTERLFYFTIFAIFFGFLTFYKNRDRVEKEIEDEKNNEERGEKKRKEEFDSKFPRIAKIWGLRSIVKWMYKEGWWYSGGVIGIFILFITIKIIMFLVFKGSFNDEYYHIFSGIDLFNKGHFAEIYFGEHYSRGFYISFLVGLFFKLFGQSLLVAKIVPATIGLVNFFLIYFISKKILIRKRTIILFLLTYALFFTTTFNHFYIRMYVIYELFMLLLIFWFLFINSLKMKGNLFTFKLNIFLLIVLNILFRFFIGGAESNIINVLTFFFFFFKSNHHFFKLLKNKKYLFIIIVGFVPLFLIIFFQKENIYLLISNLLNPFGKYLTNIGYVSYFFENFNFFLSFFFIFSVLFVRDNSKKIIIYSVAGLFCIHFISSPTIQLIRGIMYFMPIFLMVSFFSIEKIRSKKIYFLVIFLLILSIVNGYPPNFFQHPYLEKEINYVDNRAFEDIPLYCNNSIIITSSRPGIFLTYGLEADFYLNTKYSNETWVKNDPESLLAHFDEEYSGFIDTYSKTRIIENSFDLKEIILKNKGICFIGGGLPYSWVDGDSRKVLNSNMKLIKRYESNLDYNRMSIYKRG